MDADAPPVALGVLAAADEAERPHGSFSDDDTDDDSDEGCDDFPVEPALPIFESPTATRGLENTAPSRTTWN